MWYNKGMENKNVYLLEDDKAIQELVTCALDLGGIQVAVFGTCSDFLAAVAKQLPSLAVLDIMLPDGSGLDVLQVLKQRYRDLPVIMLSAMSSEANKVRGLNAGADDYITKPFGVLEFSARVSAHIRRASGGAKNITVGCLTLDSGKMQAFIGEKELELNLKEFSLLEFFMTNVGLVLSRDKILQEVWGYSTGETRTVDNHVARLRKLGINIITVFGSGYKLDQ